MIQLGQKIMSSMLAPWQRINALKTFLYPALNFHMRCGNIGKTEWARLDKALRPMIKRSLYLPSSASGNYLHGSRQAGACGIPIAAEVSDLCRIDSAFKLLSSRDSEVTQHAEAELQRTITERLGRQCTRSDMGVYLAGDTEGEYRTTSNPIQNVWTEARKASHRLGMTWELRESGQPSVTRGTITVTTRHRSRLMAIFRKQLNQSRDCDLQALPNQGKAMECVAADRASSHFISNGDYTRFANWRFIHRARLNLVPLNGAKPWSTNDKRCRTCGFQSETLPHVLNNCMRNSAAYTQRHNDIVSRIKSAAEKKFSVKWENQAVGSTHLRPDLVLTQGETAIIVDVAIPFENRTDSLQAKRREKEQKYEPVKQYLLQRFNRVSIEAVIIGSLGSWDPNNDRLLKRLCSNNYLKKLKRLAVSDVIRRSRDIYHGHATLPRFTEKQMSCNVLNSRLYNL
ncbi:uncharacterized protein LOC135372751 [Ornithodoros turicata]|uniref:uncharacterized protein LOC135372751 n=1 Tax=Ornithodoros turicata TaxID=34597 RepID=UPI0031388D41